MESKTPRRSTGEMSANLVASNVGAVVSAFLRDPGVDKRSTKVSDRLSDNIQGLANEPSLAFYRIQEHVRKVVPSMAERKSQVDSANSRLEEACEDLHYDAKTVADLRKATSHFANLADLLRHAAFYQQQLVHLQQQKVHRNLSSGGQGK